MNYAIQIGENVEVVRATTWHVMSRMLIASLILFSILFIKEFFSNTYDPFSILNIALFFLASGCMFHGFRAGATLSNYPDRVLFNNAKAVVVIFQKKSLIQQFEIPYADVAAIEWCRVTHFRDAKINDMNGAKAYYSYHVVIRQKDGSNWELIEAGNEEKASKYAREISAHVHLSNKPANISYCNLSDENILIAQTPQTLEIAWRKAVSSQWLYLVISLFSLLIVASAIWTFRDNAIFSENNIVWVLPGTIALLLTTFFFYNLNGIVRRLKPNSLNVQSDRLVYNNIVVDATQIQAVHFDYYQDSDLRKVYITDTVPVREFEKHHWLDSYSVYSKQVDHRNILLSLSFDKLQALDVLYIKYLIKARVL